MIVILILSVILNIILIYCVTNILRKHEIQEYFVESILARVKQVLAQMRAIDIRGSFEADDEVGTVFKALLKLIEELEAFLPSETKE